MTTIERGPRATDRFAIIANDALADERLSFRARGLLAYLLSRPEGWRTNSETLATQATEGRDAIRTALRELEQAGYLQRTRTQGEGGKWVHTTRIHDHPTTSDGFPGDGFPGAGQPSPDGQAVSTKTESKTERKTSAATQRAESAPQGIDYGNVIATKVYEATDRGVRFMAVKAVATSVLRARTTTAWETITDAMVGLYRAGKPITITTVCQVLDGALNLNGASSARAARDRGAWSKEWRDGTAVAEWEAVAGGPAQ